VRHLQDAVQGVEGKAGKGAQRVLLVVLVVDVVQLPAARTRTFVGKRCQQMRTAS